jgi:hypothetical protein
MPTVHHMDGFDFYASAQNLLHWTGNNSATIGAFGRNGTPGLRTGNSVNGCWKDIANGFATHYMGVSMKTTTLIGARHPIFVFVDTGTAGAAGVQCGLYLNGVNQKLEVWRSTPITGGGGVLLATGTAIMSNGVERYITCKVVISDTVGEFVVTVNGVTDINISAQDTKITANAYANRGMLANDAAYNGDTILDWDDFWWNDYEDWGDVRVEGRLPNGNGATSAFVGSDGNSVDNYLLVDEATPNSDTDYVGSATPGDIDTYAMQNATPTSGTVKAVGIHLFARKDDAGVRTIAPVVREGGVNYLGANQNIGTSYVYVSEYYRKNPATTNDWTLSEINADEFGVKVVA